MPTDQRAASITRTRERLRASRAQLFTLARQIKGESSPDNSLFPRSGIMRALLGQGGNALLGAAALGLGMWGPRWIRVLWRLAPVAPLLRGALNRYLMRRIFR